jgi:hypothetical protein
VINLAAQPAITLPPSPRRLCQPLLPAIIDARLAGVEMSPHRDNSILRWLEERPKPRLSSSQSTSYD